MTPHGDGPSSYRPPEMTQDTPRITFQDRRDDAERNGCGVREGRTALHCLGPSRVITPIPTSPGAFLVRKTQS